MNREQQRHADALTPRQRMQAAYIDALPRAFKLRLQAMNKTRGAKMLEAWLDHFYAAIDRVEATHGPNVLRSVRAKRAFAMADATFAASPPHFDASGVLVSGALYPLTSPMYVAPAPAPQEPCKLCGAMKPATDHDGHGLGECVATCETCEGVGAVEVPAFSHAIEAQTTDVECPTCHGVGGVPFATDDEVAPATDAAPSSDA